VQVAGRTLIDHVLDRCVEAGVKRAVVNVHAFADLLEAHLARRTDIEIIISDERALLMETGGGIRQARAILGDRPILVSNIDSVWSEPHGSAMARLAYSFDVSRMGAQLLLAAMDSQLGYEGAGDFFMDEHGKLMFREALPHTPWLPMPEIEDGLNRAPGWRSSMSGMWGSLCVTGDAAAKPSGMIRTRVPVRSHASRGLSDP